MKIVIPGGSGQVGTFLARHFHAKGDEVVVLTRRKNSSTPWKNVIWDGQTLGPWIGELTGSDVLINLAGKSVNCRYNWKNRWEILSSRTRSVRILGRAFEELSSPPPVWLQASTATIYAHSFDSPNDETAGVIGGSENHVPDTWRFSIDVARAWEGEFNMLKTPKTRKVLLRSALTMNPDRNSIFDYLLWLVRCGLGGRAGSGKQYVSWIHDRDFIRAIEWLIENEKLSGAINLASPSPLSNSDFMASLRKAWNKSWGLPAEEWMLEIGALFLRTESELVLKSRRVVPGRLTESGFDFHFPRWEAASADLCNRWKKMNNN